MTNPAFPDGCTNREIDQEVNPLMGDDINELNDQLERVRELLSDLQMEENEIELKKMELEKEEAEIIQKIEELR